MRQGICEVDMAGPEVGVFLPTMSGPGKLPGDVAASARRVEELGFESAWVVDQLVAGEGSPLVDSTGALAAAAAVTTRIQLGFGVMILPLRPVVWAAKSVASLQQVSGDRIIRGVGAGGDRHGGMYGAPAEMIDTMLLQGDPAQLAARLHALGEAGAARVVITIAAGDWSSQAELIAESRALVG